ncbi:MAG: VIT1/CCC1 transporter family protein [Planctomycetes bacterium]|nr:VIT1/CCC1 transporter family protein [Planctomycetota bacterium]
MPTPSPLPPDAAADSAKPGRARVLEPIERVTEVLFGLIMVLTFTGSFSAAGAGRAEVRELLLGALGCNLAWGVIDGIMYMMGCLSERAARIRLVREVRDASDPAVAHRTIAAALPPLAVQVMQPADLERVRQILHALPEPPRRPGLIASDWLGALAVFLWVFLCTFPVVIPFLLTQDAALAMRVSNATAVVLLFLTGSAFGRCAGLRPWWTGLAMLVLGLVLVAITIALGG